MIAILTSEVSSVARKLAFWEYAEYISESVVVLACFGEYVAEYTKWPARWTDEQRHHLGRRSLIFLILGIGLSLYALIQTNALSGQVIGTLGQQAADAQTKAETAISSLSQALSDSREAVKSSSNALSQANTAQQSASSALDLAKGAHKEADSFERDIVSAKKQAAEAESHLADAQERAANATKALERLTSPRGLQNLKQLVATLETFKGTEYTFSAVYSDQESLQLLAQINDVLKKAGWNRGKPVGGFPAINVFGTSDPYAVPAALNNGIQITVEWPEEVPQSLEQLPPLVRAAVILNKALSGNLTPAEKSPSLVNVEKGDSKTIRIAVGKKPID
jgi:hypothetical protein